MKSDRKTRTLEFDTKIYPQEAVMGAAYKMIGDLYVHLESGDGCTVAKLTDRNGSEAPLEELTSEFMEEVLSQSLRIKILKATRKTRDQILKIAITYAPFLPRENGQLVSAVQQPQQQAQQRCGCEDEEIDRAVEQILQQLKEEDVSHDFVEDPMGIMVPWEEKNAGGSDEKEPCGCAEGAPAVENQLSEDQKRG